MASNNSLQTFIWLVVSLMLFVQGSRGGIICESLDSSTCAFAISSLGGRCVLEKRLWRSGQIEFLCCSSGIKVEKLADLVESDECIEACGLSRNTVGISSDSLVEGQFTQKLCSPQCYNNCPNIVDLYFNLAAGEENDCSKSNYGDLKFWVCSSSMADVEVRTQIGSGSCSEYR